MSARPALAIVASVLLTVAVVPPCAAQAPRQVVRVQTAHGTITALERPSRGLVYRTAEGILNAVTVAPEITIYDDLSVGDVIVCDYIEAAVLKVAPGATLTTLVETTAAAKANVADPLVKIDQQLEVTVTIDEIDLEKGTITYHALDNRRIRRGIASPSVAAGLAVGDVVQVQYTRERAISVRRAAR